MDLHWSLPPRFRFVVNHSLCPLTVRISAKILPVTRQAGRVATVNQAIGKQVCPSLGSNEVPVKSIGSCGNSDSWCCPSMTLDLRLKANTPDLIIWLPLCNYICGISRYEIWPGQARPRSIGVRKHKMGRQISPSTDPSRAQILFWFRPVPLLLQLSSHDLLNGQKTENQTKGNPTLYSACRLYLWKSNQKCAKKCNVNLIKEILLVFMTLLIN